jgi:hypothetical protein
LWGWKEVRWRDEVDVEEVLMGLERGGLFFGFVFLWDIFFVQREDFALLARKVCKNLTHL